jgi:4-hydroxythreonine-4-phosphate dehydrogenase
MKPIIGITMGDAAGIGPELILKTLSDSQVYNKCLPVVIGSYGWLNKLYVELHRKNKVSDLNLVLIDSAAKLKSNSSSSYPEVLIYDDFNLNFENIKVGQVNEECGKASVLYLSKVVDLIGEGLVDGTCSAPVNKEAMNMAGYHYNGQKEYFTEITGAKKVVPLIIIGNVRMFQMTAHISLKQMLSSLNSRQIFETIVFADDSLKNIGIENPRISIAGINPHAGENGLLGMEEIEVFKPAIEQAKNKGINVSGPFPADSLFLRVKDGEFDCIITIYHDQATIAMKLLGTPTTMTLGLPFIRTSVGHGTAYDIAGLHIADESVFKKSLIVCAESIKK